MRRSTDFTYYGYNCGSLYKRWQKTTVSCWMNALIAFVTCRISFEIYPKLVSEFSRYFYQVSVDFVLSAFFKRFWFEFSAKIQTEWFLPMYPAETLDKTEIYVRFDMNTCSCWNFNFRFRPGQFTARVGEWNLADQDNYSREFRILHIQAHPDFKANGFYNDVALFTLDQPVRFTE